jgi:ABC-type enterochelin transport system substrate-binding protein
MLTMEEASEIETDKKKESYKRLYLSHKMYKKIQDIIVDLGWEAQRMTSSGQESYDKLCDIFNIESENNSE